MSKARRAATLDIIVPEWMRGLGELLSDGNENVVKSSAKKPSEHVGRATIKPGQMRRSCAQKPNIFAPSPALSSVPFHSILFVVLYTIEPPCFKIFTSYPVNRSNASEFSFRG